MKSTFVSPKKDSTWKRVVLKLRQLYMQRYKPGMTGKSKLALNSADYANKLLYNALLKDKPFMFGRFGSTELTALTNYLGVKNPSHNFIKLIKGDIQPWWWIYFVRKAMQENSGFFPTTPENLYQFGELMMEDMKELDLIANLSAPEELFRHNFPKAARVSFNSIEPFFAVNPWTHALAGKTVLVVHPMTESINKQWEIREKIWPCGMMPEFELKTFKAVQTLAGEECEFKNWFEVLDYMKHEINQIDFDICIIGCGAYGFPLAAHVKRMGKKALHFAGVTQLLFGIKGKRWEIDPHIPFTNFMNEYWIRPGESEKPKNAILVEGGCYW